MRISTKGRYALRLMLDLALHNTGTPVRVKEIAARQEISDKYLEQIINMLSRAKYVKSTRGAKGGYRLTNSPDFYTVGMILRTIEGSLAPLSCIEDENECNQVERCLLCELWSEINDAINGVIDHVTLADLVRRYQDSVGYDYII